MMSRIKIYEIRDCIKNNFSIDISDYARNADNIFSCINIIENSYSIDNKIKMVRKLEKKIKEIIQFMISQLNPDLNSIIEEYERLNSNEHSCYGTFVILLREIMNQIEKRKDEIMNASIQKGNKLNFDFTCQMKLESFSSYIYGLLDSLFYIPLNESLIKYYKINNPKLIKKKMEKTKKSESIIFEEVPIEKDKDLFWFLVFSYLFRASQVGIGLIPDKTASDKLKEKYEVQKSLLFGVSENKEEEHNNTDDESDEDDEEDSETEEVELSPEINGAEEQTYENYDEENEEEEN